MSGAVAIPRFTPNLPLKSTYFPATRWSSGSSNAESNIPQVNHLPLVNNSFGGGQNKQISQFTVASNGLLIQNNNQIEDAAAKNNIEVTQETVERPSVVVQTRPQSFDVYIHDERDLIPRGKKTVLIIDGETEDGIVTIEEERITPSRQWLLNQRQGDETDRITERDPVPIAPRVQEFSSSLAGDAYNQLPDLTPYQDDSNDGVDYLRSLEYSVDQAAEQSIKPKFNQSYPGMKDSSSLSTRSARDAVVRQALTPIKLDLVDGSKNVLLLSQIKSSPTKISQYNLPQSLYQVDIPELTMPQEFLQTGREPLQGPNLIPVFPMSTRNTYSVNIPTSSQKSQSFNQGDIRRVSEGISQVS